MGFFADNAQSGDYIKFDDSNINTPQVLEIAGKYKVQQHTYKGVPSVYASGPNQGQPKWESVIPVKTANGEIKTLATGTKYRLVGAIGNAVVSTGAQDLEIGGKLTITYKGKVQAGSGQAQTFEATYERAPEGSPLATPDFDPSAQPQVPQTPPAPGNVPAYGQAGGGQPQGQFPPQGQGGGYGHAPQGYGQGGSEAGGYGSYGR